ncbi:response regulator transcription factor [Chloroflexota bacterium]
MVINIIINPKYKWQENAKKKGISHRELEVLELIAQGYDNKQIAEILNIQYQSVKNHTYQLNNKLGAGRGI